MNKITEAFYSGKAFIGFVTAGDPDLKTTEQLIYSMQEAGADIIEIGIPFSDPIAEGEVIQAANKRALDGGITTDKIFDFLKEIKKNIKVPIVFLTYINPIYTYGKQRFIEKCIDSGIQGIIIPDLPYEEKRELDALCKENNLCMISLVSPTSKERIKMIARESEGFVYCVSSLGVTGVRNEISSDVQDMVDTVKNIKDIPCALGFGIATPEQAKKMSSISDGVIVGSAIVKLVEKYRQKSPEHVYNYVKSMKNAML